MRTVLRQRIGLSLLMKVADRCLAQFGGDARQQVLSRLQQRMGRARVVRQPEQRPETIVPPTVRSQVEPRKRGMTLWRQTKKSAPPQPAVGPDFRNEPEPQERGGEWLAALGLILLFFAAAEYSKWLTDGDGYFVTLWSPGRDAVGTANPLVHFYLLLGALACRPLARAIREYVLAPRTVFVGRRMVATVRLCGVLQLALLGLAVLKVLALLATNRGQTVVPGAVCLFWIPIAIDLNLVVLVFLTLNLPSVQSPSCFFPEPPGATQNETYTTEKNQ